ncbi:hypothetical protein BGZ63DRAFT_405277 [Mariannaea sp. PMI_226]|nr:hypothetical protein BGZ63DRAFT_405277 [Mariannaea sp. PMI_226]
MPSLADTEDHYDVVVIGVEESGRLGDVSCVRKAFFFNACAVSQAINDATGYGYCLRDKGQLDWEDLKQKCDWRIRDLTDPENLDGLPVWAEYVAAHASLGKEKGSVILKAVDGSNKQKKIRAEKIIIAVGSCPIVPDDIPGANLGITPEAFFDLEQQPKTAAIVGEDYIAVELAGILGTLGTKTHVYIKGETLLPTFDPMVQKVVTGQFHHSATKLHRESIERLESTDGSITVHCKDTDPLYVDVLIWSLGRKPRTVGLGLQDAGIRLDQNECYVAVNEYHNTNLENVFAIGDVTGQTELAPGAIFHGRDLADRLSDREPVSTSKVSNEFTTPVVLARPEIGSIGMTEPLARQKYGGDVKIYEKSFDSLYDSSIGNPSNYKLICAGPDERVVGLHIVGRGSADILQGFAVAMTMGATKADFDRCMSTYPMNAWNLVTMT